MKKRILIAGGIVVLVVLLAGAAFVGGQLLTEQGLPGQASSGGNGRNQNIPAKELPQTPADVSGVFDHRQDNSIFVGTGQVGKMATTDQSGQVHFSLTHTGPTIEVVVSPQTKVYRDVTSQQYTDQQLRNESVQQVVEPGSLDEVGQPSIVTAWGKKTGNRIIADVLVYTPPPVQRTR
jgi:hypothetical protein